MNYRFTVPQSPQEPIWIWCQSGHFGGFRHMAVEPISLLRFFIIMLLSYTLAVATHTNKWLNIVYLPPQ
jgi:hypothetical protein